MKRWLGTPPAAIIPDWRTQICGAWLNKVGNKFITSIEEAAAAIKSLVESGHTNMVLLSHPETWPNLSHNGLRIISMAPFSQNTHEQLNNRWEFTTVTKYLCSSTPLYK